VRAGTPGCQCSQRVWQAEQVAGWWRCRPQAGLRSRIRAPPFRLRTLAR